MTVDVIQLASLITSIGVIIGAIVGGYKLLDNFKKSDEKHEADINKLNTKMKNIQKEQTLICYCINAVLDGLKQQGCNGEVTKALDLMNKHLNKAAHEQE